MYMDDRWLKGFYTPGGKIPPGKDGIYVWGEKDAKGNISWFSRAVTEAEARALGLHVPQYKERGDE